MACTPGRTRATLRFAMIGLLAALGACAESPSLLPEEMAPDGPSSVMLPGVTGTACRTNYIDDGAGGCIYAPQVDDESGGTGGTTTPTGTTGGSSGGGTTPPPPEGTDPDSCKTGNAVVDDPVVNAGFEALWEQSNFDAPLADRLEAFGWVVKTATGYRIEIVGTGNFCGYTGVAPWPPEGGSAIVGFIHTHPYTVGETVLSCGASGNINGAVDYPGTPSDFDRNLSVALGQQLGRGQPLPGLVLDANGIRSFEGWDAAVETSYGRCGY